MAHGRTTPAREGFDYSNPRLQDADLNALEEAVRRRLGKPVTAGGSEDLKLLEEMLREGRRLSMQGSYERKPPAV